MNPDQHMIDRAAENAPRMAHMSDVDIRIAIAQTKTGLMGFGHGMGLGAMSSERLAHEELAIYRAELLRRACAAFGLPMLDTVKMAGLRDSERLGKLRTDNAKLIVICNEMVEMGLFHDHTRDLSGTREYRLTAMGRDIVEAAHDEAISLKQAIDAFMGALMAPYAVAAE